MSKPLLRVTIISQEKQLETVEAEQVTATTSEGEITVLPGHIPLFARLETGELRYQKGAETSTFVVSKGFLDVGPDAHVTVLVDIAVDAREISVDKAEAAIKAAHETMAQSVDRHELMMAEASLRLALLEIKVAQKTKRAARI
ncbi:ATP synthase F1 subunit epsilon [Patescibacteria group bacterium]|nr:ATP synthase F1 subunit epsilon [Patescibacteria group bacterium]